jgi:hypothetical protein
MKNTCLLCNGQLDLSQVDKTAVHAKHFYGSRTLICPECNEKSDRRKRKQQGRQPENSGFILFDIFDLRSNIGRRRIRVKRRRRK